MIRTIRIGSCVSVQGTVLRKLADGTLVVQVGKQTFVGYPVAASSA